MIANADKDEQLILHKFCFLIVVIIISSITNHATLLGKKGNVGFPTFG